MTGKGKVKAWKSKSRENDKLVRKVDQHSVMVSTCGL